MGFGPWHSLVDANLMAAVETVFQEDILYTPGGGAQVGPFPGMFEAAASTVEVDGEVQVESRKPVLRVRLKNLTDLGIDPEHNDRVVIRGLNYRVVETQPDGHAEITLILKRTI